MSPDRKTRPAFECEVSPMSSDICHRCSRTKLLPMFPLAQLVRAVRAPNGRDPRS